MQPPLVLLAFVVTIGCSTGTVTQSHRLVGTGIHPPSISMLSPSTVPVNIPNSHLPW